jgi:Rieske Fe-S protein
MPEESRAINALPEEPPRRSFLTTASGLLMTGGLAAAYGTFGVMLGKFVYPAGSGNRGWIFVCSLDHLALGEAMDFTAPSGAKIVVARQAAGVTADDFLALSSVCPHLGCRVHWESQGERFFCPCHNGAFDRSGQPIAGPPKAANQSLIRYPLKVEEGLLYIEAPLTALASAADCAAPHESGVA